MKITIIALGIILSVSLQADILDDAEYTIQNNNPQKGMQMYNNACRTGNNKACNILGSIYLEGFEGLANKNTKRANTYFSQACERNHIDSCIILGAQYLSGSEIPQNLSKATYYFKKVCYQGYINKCELAADTLTMAKNYQQALSLYNKACQGNIAGSCFKVGAMYLTGQGIRKNIKQGKVYLNKACKMNHKESCDFLVRINKAGMK